MTTKADSAGAHVDHFRRHESELRRRGGTWLHDLRTDAIRRFETLGFPSTREEDWRYTNVAPIASAGFKPARPSQNGLREADLAPFLLGGESGSRLVFVDGHFRAELSRVGEGVRAGSLADALTADQALLREHLGGHVEREQNAFAALNTAFLEDGAFVEVPEGAVHEEPIHLLFVATAEGTVSHPRVLIVAGGDSEARILENYVTLGSKRHFTNAVTEIVVGANAVVDHYRLQLEDESAFHISSVDVLQRSDSRCTTTALTFGGALVRNDLRSVLDGEGAVSELNGVYLVRGRQHVDNHTLIEHRKPRCNSIELYKGILDDHSTGVFRGRIHVFPDAQKTDAIQSNASLLLSEDATADTKPQLEIYADDVKCTHGATVGQLDEKAMFYLRTRGLAETQARNLLVRAFAGEITERVRVEAARARLEGLLVERLPGGNGAA